MFIKKKKNNLSPNFLKGFEKKKGSFKKIGWIDLIFKSSKEYFLVFKKNKHKNSCFTEVLKENDKKLKKYRKQIIKKIYHLKINNENKGLDINYWQSILFFILTLLFLVIPFKILATFHILGADNLEKRIMNSSKSAINNLLGAGKSVVDMDFSEANKSFGLAGQDFFQAEKELPIFSDHLLSLASLSSDPKLKLAAEAKNFLRIGALSSDLGLELSASLEGLDEKKENPILILKMFLEHGKIATNKASELRRELNKVNINNLPVDYRDEFLLFKDKISDLPEILANLVEDVENLKFFLGSGRDKRYLLVFQNNAEMRASGGFIGSYALVDFREGKIRNLEVPGGGSYDTEAGLLVKIKAPEPLRLVNPQWHFWDANWWPDWPTTAKNLMWFYEKSDGPSVDGVISFTPTVVEKLLLITGPIDLQEDYGLVIDADNFWEQVQLTTERDNIIKTNPTAVAHLPEGEENKPKKIIGDLMTKILEVLPEKIDRKNLIKLLNVVDESLNEKQVMFYFNDSKLEKFVSDHNWDGAMKESPLDYLMLVNTNIAGAKTDKYIKEEINHFTNVDEAGDIVDTVIIKRTHLAEKNSPLVGVRNVNWLRLYVPEGSTLLESSGFSQPDAKYFDEPGDDWLENDFLKKTENLAITDPETKTKIYQENGKTVFANWVMLDPGHSQTIMFRYKLPNNLWEKNSLKSLKDNFYDWLRGEGDDFYKYSLLVQKQAGESDQLFNSSLILPKKSSVVWSSDTSSNILLNKDMFYSKLIRYK